MPHVKFPVEAGHILIFARAIGDTNPVYSDPDAAARGEAGGIIAPPTFAAASAQFDPDEHRRPQPGKPWRGSGATPSGTAGARQPGDGNLHAEQHYEYHRHPRPGDVLTVETRPGRTWEKPSRRAGTLRFTERIVEYRDQNGELVITARSIGVIPERPVDAG